MVALQVVLVAGTVGFRVILDEPWISSLYRAVVTVSLTGLDTKPEGAAAELFTIFLLVSGVAIFLYVAGSIVELFARTVLTGGARRKRHIIENLSDHFIVCGYGRVGRRVAAELRAGGAESVVVDVNPDAVGAAAADGFHVVLGDGTEDADLGHGGRTIGELRVRDVTGALVIALRTRGGGFETTPGPDVALEVGDVLIGVGTAEEIRKLEQMFAPSGAFAG